ncbi:STM4015 family protein [Luteolibacter soli]|uniref:STM4015 family protein n=1 Tax=Luteolibacter soli TaxID=3135280 RepID=A0ABU9B0S7_9BACT
MIDDHLKEWFGQKVEDYQPGAGYGLSIPRFGYSYDDEDAFSPEIVATYLADPRAATIKALVFGMPGESGESFQAIIRILVDHAGKLPALRGIFLGDIEQEENEMSWIEQGDIGLILAAFPNLEELRVRGQSSLELSPCKNEGLKRLTIETGGMPTAVLHNLARCSFPNLEHLELWLGDDGYGWEGDLDDVLPAIEPALFPKLKSLGIRNSLIADELAEAMTNAPVLGQLEALDLSLGTMTDKGAEALIASGKVRNLKSLNLHRNYLTDATIARLQGLGPKVDVGAQEKPDDWDGEPHYYVAVGE